VPQAAWARDLTPPAVELPARYALVARGAESKQQFLEAFGAAIGPYRDGRYAEAASGLEAVARRFPDIPEAGFYLGVSRLLSGDARGALEPLARAREAETLGDAARWYRAAASEQAGDSVSAVAALGELCGRPGDFKARACAALEPTRRP
jgi:TolA-binding protein